MAKRKSYRKVQGGCFTCKERKVRCDLERPECKNCRRVSRPCTYPGLAQFTTRSSPDRVVPPSTSALEVELMHHYTAYTYLTVTNNPVLISLWKEVVPKHAFRHRFLLQGLLAVAARHKLHENKTMPNSAELIEAADLYQQEALATYIHLLDNITEENCHALFAFSQILVGLSYSRLSLNIHERAEHPEELIIRIAEIFDLLRGTLVIGYRASTWLFEGDLAPMMGPPPDKPLPETIAASHTPGIQALSTLFDHIAIQKDNGNMANDQAETLLSTMELLYTLFLEEFPPEDRLNRFVGLPVFLDPSYFALLKAQDPAALIVMAYYGLMLYRIRHVWVFDGIGARIVEAVADLVGENWSEHLTWPQMQIRDGVKPCPSSEAANFDRDANRVVPG